MLRRAIYAVTIVLMNDHPLGQMIIMILMSLFTMIIIFRAKPFEYALTKWTMFSFEFLFMFICVLSLLFTPTYAWYSADRLNSTGLFICMLTVFTCALGFFLQLYSICWQNAFYTRRRKNLILKAERSRLMLENSQRQKLTVVDEAVEEDGGTYREYHMNAR